MSNHGKVHPLLEHLRRALIQSPSVEGLRLLVAVSGGIDSMVLLHALSEVSESCGCLLAVAHFDHGLRETSVRDREIVRGFADKLGFPFEHERALPFNGEENLEAWARTERYAFLERARVRASADLVVTAHHAGDQAETLLMRLISGRFATDAHSIASYDAERRLLRPLLGVERSLIENYAKDYAIPFAEDETNADLSRTRNRIRHSLLPLLHEEFNPSLSRSLSESAERINLDETYLNEQAIAAYEAVEQPLGVAQLMELPLPLRWRVLRLEAMKHCGEQAKRLGYRSLRDLLRSSEERLNRERSFDLGAGVRGHITADDLITFSTEPIEDQVPLAPESLEVPGEIRRSYDDGTEVRLVAEVVTIDSFEDCLHRARNEQGDSLMQASCYLDADRVSGSFVVRERADGDRVRVFGRGERKIKKLFQERGLPAGLRDRLPLVEGSEGIVWIPG